ncbi:MAG TPA: glutathione S-transferase family protein [Solirubrobacterales bacterium]|nr:glutathione S-transferase family protein [Solirubrobacterales bacterium]
MIRLFRAEWSTNCERVGLALAHKGLEVESVTIDYSDRGPVEEISGQGLVPVIDDDGRVVNDSRAILAYLEDRYPDPPLFPADPARRTEVELFGDWFERVYKAAPNAIEDELERADPDAALVQRCGREMRERLDAFERLLNGRDYLYGEFGAADCIAFPFLKYAAGRDSADDELFHRILEEHQPVGEDHPRLAAWIDRVAQRPRAY